MKMTKNQQIIQVADGLGTALRAIGVTTVTANIQAFDQALGSAWSDWDGAKYYPSIKVNLGTDSGLYNEFAGYHQRRGQAVQRRQKGPVFELLPAEGKDWTPAESLSYFCDTAALSDDHMWCDLARSFESARESPKSHTPSQPHE
jgi:hypothetical protein